jgi:hypothetical protein
VEVFANPKAMDTLLEVEGGEKYCGVGCAMLKEFFPGELHPDEEGKWEALKNRPDANNVSQSAVKVGNVTRKNTR